MKALTVLSAAVALASCGGPQHRPPRSRMSVKEIVVQSKPAIVRIEATVNGQPQVGTGFAVDPSGIIATNLHVVAGAEEIKVTLLDGSAFPVARVVGVDPERDLTLLSIEQPMPSLTLGDSDLVAAGDPVIAIGNPLGVLDYTVSDGLISSIRVASESLTLLQTSAPISQGSSGGPLFNPFGEVIGVAMAIFTEGQNLNLAIPSNYVATMLTVPRPISMAEFAEATKLPPPLVREVPNHDVAVLDGCDDAAVIEVAGAIASAIDVGAPLYNEGKHDECFQIYAATAERYEREAACEGVRRAFGAGLERAAKVETATAKAWALRDTFDGLLDVILRRQTAKP